MPWDLIPLPYLLGALVLLVLVAMIIGAVQRSLPGGRRRPILPLRWRAVLRLHPGPGWIGGWERWRVLGLPSARRTARVVRRNLTWWQIRKPGGWKEYATLLGYAWGWVVRRKVVAGPESVVFVLAGPRRGKTGASGERILDAPGKVVATSIRDDALSKTVGPRSEKGKIFVWNPEGAGRFGSTLRYDPVEGCRDPRVAVRKAGRMVFSQDSAGLSDAAFWNNQACMVLAGYLHAAALVGYDMRHVYAWISGSDETPLRILREAENADGAQRQVVQRFLQTMPDRTQQSVTTTLSGVLQFMTHPDISRMLAHSDNAQEELGLPEWFDPAEFVSDTDCSTLYLVSNGEDSVTRPLFAALLAEIAHEVRQAASASPDGRLPMPIDMELDEIANTAPVPVDQWASWMGGCGVRIRVYAQTWSQVVKRYGAQGAESLWACASHIVVYGGTNEKEVISRVRDLAGKVQVRGRDRIHHSYNREGEKVREREKTFETVDVIDDLRMPAFHAIVLHSDGPPALVRTPRVWLRPEVMRWKNRMPEGLAAPERSQTPEVDRQLRERMEQSAVHARPLRVVATGTDDVTAFEEPTKKETSASTTEAATQPMPSVATERERVRVRATPPPPRSTAQGLGRGESSGSDRGTPPPLRRRPASSPTTPAGSDASASPTPLHPAPWDLSRSEPMPPQEGEDQAPKRARMPWDEDEG
ncbi:TraM recognition domain-containing protein [Nocardiopsis dassonvillei]|uniref:TraM recognition domain-containing protein n=1 Tax=Nocardiopsis dassonvillei TaxID=2014 RepID=UPI00366F25FA